jgi:hypothetical protein
MEIERGEKGLARVIQDHLGVTEKLVRNHIQPVQLLRQLSPSLSAEHSLRSDLQLQALLASTAEMRQRVQSMLED